MYKKKWNLWIDLFQIRVASLSEISAEFSLGYYRITLDFTSPTIFYFHACDIRLTLLDKIGISYPSSSGICSLVGKFLGPSINYSIRFEIPIIQTKYPADRNCPGLQSLRLL